MQKRTLFLVVAILGVLTLVGSGQLRTFQLPMLGGGMDGSTMSSYGPAAPIYDTFATKESAGVDVVANRAMIAPYPGGMGGDALGEPDRAIEYSASHNLVVDDVPTYMQDIRAYVQSVGGQVLYWNQGKEPLQLYRYGSMTAKVPVSSFEPALNKITSGVKDIITEHQNMADVTGQKEYSNEEVERLRGEIAVLEAELAETTTESARVRIQNQLAQLRRQLSDAERGVEQVAELVDYATVSITVSDSERYFGGRHQPSPGEDIREALQSVWRSIGSVIRLVIWVAVYAVIWLPVVALVGWMWKRTVGK